MTLAPVRHKALPDFMHDYLFMGNYPKVENPATA